MEQQAKKKNWFARHKILTGILVLVGIAIIASAASGGNKAPTSSGDKSSQSAGADQAQTEAKPKQPAWDAQAVYDKLQDGMTRAQAEQIIGRGSGTCTESATPGVGTMEICSYTGGLGSKGSISVDYMNGTIYSKTKVDF